MNTKNPLIAAAALAGLVLGASGDARAQSATAGRINGRVTDAATGEGLPGVTIVATSPALQGTQSAITEVNGTYSMTNLPPGTYIVTFYFADITVKRTAITVNANKTTPVFVKLDQSQAGGEVIEIRGTPNIDTTSTTQGITLDQEYTRNIPVPGRTFESALGAAAGSAGDALGVSFSGSTSLENQYVVDGINTTGLSFGTVGSPLINDFIQEIEIITGGYNAEYGRSTGGVVNVVTKSGSNDFRGSVFTRFTSDVLALDNTRNPSEATSIDADAKLVYDLDTGFDLGGPIIKDKLWFYVGLAPRLVSSDVDRITKRRKDCHVIQDDGELSPCDPAANQDGFADRDPDTGFLVYEDIPGGRRTVNSSAQSYQFISKINYAASPEHQGQVTVSGQPSSAKSIGIFGERAATSREVSGLTTDVSTKWTSKFNDNKTEVETVLGWHRDNFKSESIDEAANDVARQTLVFGTLGQWARLGSESMETLAACTDDATGADPYPLIQNCPDGGVGYGVGGPGGLADDTENRYSGRLSATQRIKAAGSHEIKAGVDVEQNYLNKPRIFSGDAFYTVLVGNDEFGGGITEENRWVEIAPPGASDPRFDRTCGAPPGGGMGEGQLACDYLGPTDVEGNTFNWAAYLRDSWQILPNLTFNAGLRYEEQRLRYAEHLRGTADPFTGEPRGKNAMLMNNMWAPRVGLLYDWTKEGRSKVYGSYGRYYESIPMDINDRSFGGETLLTNTYNHSDCGEVRDGFGAPDGPSCEAGYADEGEEPTRDLFGGSGVLVAPGIKPQYQDEIILGAEYEVIEDVKVGLSYQRRWLGRVLEDVSVDNAATYILANPGEFPEEEEQRLEEEIADLMASGDVEGASRRQGQLDQYRGIRTFDKPRRDYNAIQLQVVKRFSNNFFAQGSYTYSRTEGNFPGLFSADNGQVDPNISSQYDLIELLSNRDGPLPQDRPHYFKLDGYYTFKFDRIGDTTVGSRVRALSGVPTEALAQHYLYGFSESFLLPRGEMGRTEWDWSVDLHAGFKRHLGNDMAIEIFTDLFNLPTLFQTEGIFSVDEDYTFRPVNPIVGGEYEDLVFAKEQTELGAETSTPVRRNGNFLNPAARYTPFFAQFWARLTF